VNSSRPLRVLAFIEARVLTGPAKNLISFACRASTADPPVEVVVATYERGNPEDNEFVRAARDAGVRVEVIGERRRFDPQVIGAIRLLIQEVEPDIVQTHAVKSHFLLLFTRVWRTIPWVAFHHGYTATDWKTEMYNRLDRLSLRRPRRIVTVCRPFADELGRRGVAADRISIIHNAVKPFRRPSNAVVEAVRSRFNLPEATPILVTIGRLSREKGHGDLLEAVATVHRTHPGLRFHVAIVGEGPERPLLERSIEALGLSTLVTLCGHHNDVAPFYAMASAVVLPSHSEGSPNVLLEAQAAGVPVVATDVGGVGEIATNGVTALLVPKRDTAELARGIARILQDPHAAATLAAAGRDNVLSRFTPEKHLHALLNVYLEAVSKTAI
jgi:glycosyltransferase involved in cell wall biosynthesis